MTACRRPASRLELLESALVVLLIVVPPLFVFPWGFDSYLFPKRIVVAAIVALLFGTVGWRTLRGHAFRVELHPVNGLFALFWLWNVVSLLWAKSGSLAVENVVWLTIIGAAALLVQSHWIGRRDRIVRSGAWLVLTGVLLSVWALVMDLWPLFGGAALPVGARLPDWRGRVSAAGLGNTGHIADFLVMSMFPALLFFLFGRTRRRRLLALAALGLLAAGLIPCWSVHSNGSLIVMALVGLMGLRRMRPRISWKGQARWLAALALVWAGAVAFFVAPHALNPHRGPTGGGIFEEAFSSQRWKEGGPTRLAIWLTTLEMIRERPFFGAGAGNFTHIYPTADSALLKSRDTLRRYAHQYTNAAHNVLLQAWAETGVLGLGLLLAAAAGALHAFHKRFQEDSRGNRMLLWAGGLALGAWALQSMMNFPLQMPVASLWLGLLASVVVAVQEKSPDGIRPILVRVEFERFGFRASAYLKNMSRPVRMALEIAGGAVERGIIRVVLVLTVIGVFYVGGRGLLADAAFQRGKQAERGWLMGPAGGGPTAIRKALEAAEPEYLEALRLWPWLTDCRSALTELYVQNGRWQDALREGAIVRRRLLAGEVFLREAVAQAGLGHEKEAGLAYAELLRRDPQWAGLNPHLAVLAKKYAPEVFEPPTD